VLAAASFHAHAGIIGGLTESDLAGSTVESFGATNVTTTSFDYGNGLTHLNLNGDVDLVRYNGGYGMGTEPFINANSGRNGGYYFGTGNTPTRFQFAFAGGTSSLGFFGAESAVSDGSLGRNGELDISFYDINDVLIDHMLVATLGTPAFEQFHGFRSDGALIGRIVFDVGHMVLDEFHFGLRSVPVPEPGTLSLLSFGLLGLWASRKRVTAAR
jgi:hypothetical protein